MAELSYPWDGIVTGDASVAHYDHDEWDDYWSMLLSYDRRTEGVIATNRDGFTDNLEVTALGHSTVRVGTGIGIVDGKIYTNDAPIDFPGNSAGLHTVVLRKSWASQTVRAAVFLSGSVTQTEGFIWEIKLADVFFDAAGVATITDQRRFIRNAPKLSNRQGGSATIWDTAGSTNYTVPNSMMQFGIRSITFGAGDYDVTHTTVFPRAYIYAPIVQATIRNLSAWTDTTFNTYSIAINADAANFSITVYRSNTMDGAVTVTYYWLAMGEPVH